ncbi:MAG TPA: acyl carrier protein [bacterium]|nr:acyl carrier protein [bacterium]HPP09016.1 acyl carrier protein [bacterium]HXK44387.1 acyl carrier protein [bacterium]
MERQEIEKKVKGVVSRILGVDESGITSESRFVEDLGAESVQSLELVAAFEEEFGIEMEEDAALQVQTVGKAIDFISKYLK